MIEGDENGHTIAWRLGAVEARLEQKADRSDVDRISDGQQRLEGKFDKAMFLLTGATLSGITATILFAINLISNANA